MKEERVHSGIRICQVRVRNFRSLKSVDVNLSRRTLLIGANNSGKTSFLETLYAAMGSGTRMLSEDDIYLAPNEVEVPCDRIIVIDLLVFQTLISRPT